MTADVGPATVGTETPPVAGSPGDNEEQNSSPKGAEIWQLLLMGGMPPGEVATSQGKITVHRHALAPWAIAADIMGRFGADVDALAKAWANPEATQDAAFAESIGQAMLASSDMIVTLVRLVVCPRMNTRADYWRFVQATEREDRYTDDFILCCLLPEDIVKLAMRYLAVNSSEFLLKNFRRLAQLGRGLGGAESQALAMIGSLSSRPSRI